MVQPKLFVFVSIALYSSLITGATREQVSAKQAIVIALQDRLMARVAPLISSQEDVRVFLSLSPIVEGISVIAASPPSARTIRVKSTGANGSFWEHSVLCKSSVDLQSSDSLNASSQLSDLTGAILENGAIQLTANALIRGSAQLRFSSFKNCARIELPLNVRFEKDLNLTLLFSFLQHSSEGSVSYSASFASPEKIDMTIEVELLRIGRAGIPLSLSLPSQPFATGSFSLLLSQKGILKIPGGAERNYSLILSPLSFSTNQSGIKAKWNSTVEFR